MIYPNIWGQTTKATLHLTTN